MAPENDPSVEALRAVILELRKIREVAVLDPPAGRELEFLAWRAEVAADVGPVLHELRSEIDALLGALSPHPKKARERFRERLRKARH